MNDIKVRFKYELDIGLLIKDTKPIRSRIVNSLAFVGQIVIAFLPHSYLQKKTKPKRSYESKNTFEAMETIDSSYETKSDYEVGERLNTNPIWDEDSEIFYFFRNGKKFVKCRNKFCPNTFEYIMIGGKLKKYCCKDCNNQVNNPKRNIKIVQI